MKIEQASKVMDQTMPNALGALVRRLRKRQKMTLGRLSELTGISVSSLSRIENTQLRLTVDRIEVLASALGVLPEDLVSGNMLRIRERMRPAKPVSRSGPRMVVDRANKRKPVIDRELSFNYLFGKDSDRSFECMHLVVQAVSIWDTDFVRHPCEKMIYVIRGDVVLYCQDREPVILQPGDALFMDGAVWHSVVAGNNQEAELLSVYFHGVEAQEGLLESRPFTPESWKAVQRN
jgi:transcriptional regulator with XRE-family HTH domain|tara:strand:- start:49767 stop:50468 length:702 start_codon:yes stop_codon:yes gene_type:complete